MIKSYVYAGILAATVLSVAPTARATSILYEPFSPNSNDHSTNYAPGTALTGQTPDGTHTWGATGGTVSGNVPVDDAVINTGNIAVPSPLTDPLLSNSVKFGGIGKSEYLPLGASYTTGTLYYSFSVDITNLGGVSVIGNAQNIAGFTNPANSTTSMGTKAVTTIGADLVGQTVTYNSDGTGTYHLGMGTTTSTTGRTYTSATYATGTTLFVVGEFNFSDVPADSTATLYVFDPATQTIPDNQSDATIAASGAAGTGTSGGTGTLNSFLFYQNGVSGSNAFGDQGITADEVRVGTTWANVTGTPEPASLSLLSLGAVALIRRRRA